MRNYNYVFPIIAAIKGSENYENQFRDVINEINSYTAKPSIQMHNVDYKLIFKPGMCWPQASVHLVS